MSQNSDNPAFEYAAATTAAPEPAEYNDDDRLRSEVITRYHQFLITIGTAEEIGRFVLKASHEMSLITIEEMTEKMGVSKRQVYRSMS